jgi:hypothetical protein
MNRGVLHKIVTYNVCNIMLYVTIFYIILINIINTN